MKKLILLIMSVLGLAQVTHAEQHEASTAFDLENVRPFINSLNAKMALGLDVDRIVEFVSSIPVDTERSIKLKVKHRGKKKDLTLHVHMDDVDAPDFYFLSSSKDLTNEIDKEISDFSNELGM